MNMCGECEDTPGLRGDELCPACNGTPDLDDAAHVPLPVIGEYVITTEPQSYTTTATQTVSVRAKRGDVAAS